MESGAYSWYSNTEIKGGYKGEWHGAEPPYSGLQPGEATGSHTALYYYADSNAQNSDGSWGNNDNSSQILIDVTDRWTATVNDDNSITITLTTVINSIKRGKILGNPNLSITNGRDISIARSFGGRVLWSVTGDPINVERTLATNVNLGTETFILKAGESTPRASIYILNHTAGVGWDVEGSTDEITAGVFFVNNLPVDYRPGATYINGQWYSHNRAGGACHGWQGNSWVEQRTQDGGTAGENPPLYQNGAWKNQYKVGING